MQPESNGTEPDWECSSSEKENGREHAGSEAETRLDDSVRDDHIPLGVDQGRGWGGGGDFGHLGELVLWDRKGGYVGGRQHCGLGGCRMVGAGRGSVSRSVLWHSNGKAAREL
ncbi:hypothetical protein KL921_004531 [Ogataea angusta]|nr:hypothetical protein KL921_004531 [Ogataea angusta]KAG7822397.1 hypothetical protein KL909_004085 [Ogataea angusta]